MPFIPSSSACGPPIFQFRLPSTLRFAFRAISASLRLSILLAATSASLPAAAPIDSAPASTAAGDAGPALLAAVARTPQLTAAARRIDAARSRIGAAGRIPDPEVGAMGSRVTADAMGENRDMWELSIRQPLPKRGERDADRDRAAAAVTLAESEFALTLAEVAADVAMNLAEADGADARAALIETQLRRFVAALAVVDARLATGTSLRLADRLTLQTRVAALTLQLDQAQRSAADARAALRGRLALAPDSPLPAYAAPALSSIAATDSAAVTNARARAAEADAMGRVARAGAQPMTAVGVRFERERSRMGKQDTVGLALSSEIPWRARGYARAEVRAAAAERAAAAADADAARHRVTATLARVDRAERLAATARRLASETQARLQVEHEALSRILSVGQFSGGMSSSDSAVLHAVDILERTTMTQIEIIETETSLRAARAELWRHVSAATLIARALDPESSTPN